MFSWPLWVSSLASLYIYSSNRYYIRLFGSMDQVGYYELAARFAGRPLNLLATTAGASSPSGARTTRRRSAARWATAR